MKKKIYVGIVILLVIVIGVLWGVEVKDNQLLRKSELEHYATKALYNEVETIQTTLLQYDRTNIPSNILELSVSSLENSYDMYAAAIYSLELGETRRAEKNFDILVSITHLLTKDTLSEDDLNRLDNEMEYIKSNYIIVENNLSNIKNKQSNYWWK
ncbi:hypothetical protein RZN22_10370 [Bacillaceae bacterium S4-13-58]